MASRDFRLHMNASYQDDTNQVDELQVAVWKDDDWEPLALDIRSPGFLLFINGLFSCQHLYMRTNSAERDIILRTAVGEMTVVAGENWDIQNVSIDFTATLFSGSPTKKDIAYITERMTHCPVSSNLPDKLVIENSVKFIAS